MNNKKGYFTVTFKNGDIVDFNRRCYYVEDFNNGTMISFIDKGNNEEIISIINVSEIKSIDRRIVDEFVKPTENRFM